MKTITLEVVIPDWAKWIAQDEDRDWFAFEAEPYINSFPCFRPMEGTRWSRLTCSQRGLAPNPNWRETLRRVE